MYDQVLPLTADGPFSADITASAWVSPSSVHEKALIADSLIFIARNHSDDLTLKSVADRACMSKYHFSRLFHRTVGITFQNYVSKTRVLRAEALLRTKPHLSVTRIAHDVGFGTLRNMENHFKSQIGLTPTQYRSHLAHRRATSFAPLG